jgi:reactive intermediate/imine deaminase
MRRALLSLSGLLLAGACSPAPRPAGEPERDEIIAVLSSELAPPGLPFSEAVRVGNLMLLSGQIGTLPGELTLVSGGLEAEARQTMENIRGVLERHGLGLQHVVKCTVMLADMAEWPAFNAIYREYFSPPYPARSALGANGLALGARVEVECLASVRSPRPS